MADIHNVQQVVNGYISLTPKVIAAVKKENLEELHGRAQVGVVTNAQVSYGAMRQVYHLHLSDMGRGKCIEKVVATEQIVHQVYTATVNLGSIKCYVMLKKSDEESVST